MTVSETYASTRRASGGVRPSAGTGRPVVVSWLALILIGVCVFTWARREDVVVALMARGVLDESATLSAIATLKWAAAVAGVVGAVASLPAVAWGLSTAGRWGPVNATGTQLALAASPVVRRAVSVAAFAAFVVAEVVRIGAVAVSSALGYLGSGLRNALYLAEFGVATSSRVLAITLRYTGVAIAAVGGLLSPLVTGAARVVGRKMALSLGGAAFVLGQGARTATIAAQVGGTALRATGRVSGEVARMVVLVGVAAGGLAAMAGRPVLAVVGTVFAGLVLVLAVSLGVVALAATIMGSTAAAVVSKGVLGVTAVFAGAASIAGTFGALAWTGTSQVMTAVGSVTSALARAAGRQLSTASSAAASGFALAWSGFSTVIRVAAIAARSIAMIVLIAVWAVTLAIGLAAGWIVVRTVGVAAAAVAVAWTGAREIAGASGSVGWRVMSAVASVMWAAVAVAAVAVAGLLRVLARAVGFVLALAWRGFATIANVTATAAWTAASAVGGLLARLTLAAGIAATLAWRGFAIVVMDVATGAWSVVSTVMLFLWGALSVVASAVGVLLRALTQAVGFVLALAWRGFASIANVTATAAWTVVSTVAPVLWTAVSVVAVALGGLLRTLAQAVGFVAGLAWRGFATVATVTAMTGWTVVSTVAPVLWTAISVVAVGVAILLRALTQAVGFVSGLAWLVVSTVAKAVATVVWIGASALLAALWTLVSVAVLVVGGVLSLLLSAIGAFLALMWRDVVSLARVVGWAVVRISRVAATAFRLLWFVLSTGAGTAGLLMAAVLSGVLAAIGYLNRGVFVAAGVVVSVSVVLWGGVSFIGHEASLVLRGVSRAAVWATASVGRGGWRLAYPLRLGGGTVLQLITTASLIAFRSIAFVVATLRLGFTSAALGAAFVAVKVSILAAEALRAGARAISSLAGRALTAPGVVPDLYEFAAGTIRSPRGGLSMSDFNLTRDRMVSLVVTLLVVFLATSGLVRVFWPAPPEPTVNVVHWATGHLFREGLLPEMAAEFNKAGHKVKSGTRITVEVVNDPSSLQAEDLLSRVTTGVRQEAVCCPAQSTPHADPTIVTPSAAHWLVPVNHAAGRTVVDLSTTRSVARAYIGIITYREMAECLGWPNKELGYADIMELRADPDGWEKYPCAKAAWGKKPIVAYTDPRTSSTGRSVLFSLYSIAAGKPPEDLTKDDISDPDVVAYVKEFQNLIDHYFIGTTVLNTKIYQGPQFGQFFIMPEDNLIHLKEGTAKAYFNGVKVGAPAFDEQMVMIYPKEGTMPRNNCACIVQAPWVTEDHVEAANMWIDFVREDKQQRAFMKAGFRPATDLQLDAALSRSYGLDPRTPKVVLNPALIDPEVAAKIDESWEDVKRPGIVTFVADTSGSMLGAKLEQAKDGLIRALDSMAGNNKIGFLSFEDTVNTRIPVAPLATNKFAIADAIQGLRAKGETALYDAVKQGIEMTAAAEGAADAIRAVVVLTDGQANKGSTELDDIIRMESRREKDIRQFRGFEDESVVVDLENHTVEKNDIIGTELVNRHWEGVQVFFIGIGDDADLDVGRLLSEATGAEFLGVTEDDLANVLAEFSGYF